MSIPPPTNALVTPLLTDLYQITMAYAHWKNNRHNDPAIFELFFRKNPFGGEYTIFCGLDECLKLVSNFKFTESDIEYLASSPSLRNCDSAFWDYLRELDCSQLELHAMKEGTLAFPRIPLMVVMGPLGICQLLETTLLTLVNYPSLVATNAARMVVAARDRTVLVETLEGTIPHQCRREPKCLEFGLRRAQGPDGGFSASKYCNVAGFVGTSNVQAGKLLGLRLAGTHAHSFVQAYYSLEEVKDLAVPDAKNGGEQAILLPRVLKYRDMLGDRFLTTNDGELAAFIAYAAAFPESFLCLIDTYETLASGLLNFCLVCLVLGDLGYTPRGIRLDSGDLAYLSLECARFFAKMAKEHDHSFFHELDIVASNDINEAVLHSINKQGHAITVFGIGTNLVTCQAQPSLGCVYKLVEISGKPRIKLSQDIAKVLIPGRKHCYRLFGTSGWPLLDLMISDGEEAPVAGKRILCRHPFVERKRAAVTASKVVPLHQTVFQNGQIAEDAMPIFEETTARVAAQLKCTRPDILRYINATPYKISVSNDLFTFLHDLWQAETPVAELH
jgi:nicotinate phosphoribosyltransferase